ncbi:MAG: UvrD-helicase domain-containing protein, partial [Tissierellia bacterium]|nr:UvrD-helicase domain-containing protein [Tissierellia bacterium]
RSNLFVVGDPKQSIYGFRGADLDVFYDVMEDMETIAGGKAITLDRNFRTVDTVLGFINGLFQKLMGDRYTELTEHHISRGAIDVEVLEKKDLELPENIKPTDYHRYYESRMIAGRIRELVENDEFRYGDFALLFRSTPSIDIYENALKECDIPYYNISGRGFYQSKEIVDIMNALKAVSNRYDTLSIVGFLRGPMIGLSDREIYWLLRHGGDSILDAMDMAIPGMGEGDRDTIRMARDTLTELAFKRGLYGLHHLIEELVDKTCYLETLLLHRGGRQAVANIYKFMDIARDFDRDVAGSLEDFIDHIDGLDDMDEPQASIESEDADVVKIMTIHKSKGLQFPVVVIPQMARGFMGGYPPILLDKDEGIGLKYDDMPIRYDYIKEKLSQKDSEENQRILYVAMTRAKERLLIGNQGSNIGFKAMVKGLMDMDRINIIEDTEEWAGSKKMIQPIGDELLKPKARKREVFPLVGELPGYDQRDFSRFSISQYMEFKRCKRRFFMEYYKRLPFGGIEGYGNGGMDSTGTSVLDPITRGNIVHKFCEYYREGIEPQDSIERIANSFGIDYDSAVARELDPYIQNYLKHYNEDYTEFYTERSFHLKTGGSYITGIIDRINIKDGKAEIIDLKTNRVHDIGALLKMYEPQLQLYTHAFQTISGIEVEAARILFLETGDWADVDID